MQTLTDAHRCHLFYFFAVNAVLVCLEIPAHEVDEDPSDELRYPSALRVEATVCDGGSLAEI